MIPDNIISNELGSELLRQSDVSVALKNLLELFDYCKDNNHEICKHEGNLIFFPEDFYNWLWSNKYEYRDLKRELGKKLDKAKSITSEEYNQVWQNSSTLDLPHEYCYTSFSNNDICVESIESMRKLILRYYAKTNNKDDFFAVVKECYPNLYFCDEVRSSLNGVSRTLSDFVPRFFKHLDALNDFYTFLSEIRERQLGNREISKIFCEKYRIKCSPQAGRSGTKSLVKEFNVDINTGQPMKIPLVCELHTKLIPDSERIYFHLGNENIEDGKIIIYRMGRHI